MIALSQVLMKGLSELFTQIHIIEGLFPRSVQITEPSLYLGTGGWEAELKFCNNKALFEKRA
jgi:hypothetical protein